MFNNVTIIVDEITGNLIKPISKFANVTMFTSSKGINSDVVASAEELNNLLVDESENYIFVASSIGAFIGWTHVHNYPNKLKGLILLDPAHPDQGTSLLAILNKHELPNSQGLENLKKFCLSTNEASETGKKQFNSIKTLYDLQLLILIAGSISFANAVPNEIDELISKDRHKMLIKCSKLSTNGKFIIIPDVGHGIASEAPDLVSEIIQKFIQEIYV